MDYERFSGGVRTIDELVKTVEVSTKADLHVRIEIYQQVWPAESRFRAKFFVQDETSVLERGESTWVQRVDAPWVEKKDLSDALADAIDFASGF